MGAITSVIGAPAIANGRPAVRSDSPPDSWYLEPDDEPDHECRGVWCTDRSHRDDD
jgi:hypothetical protein